MPASSPLAEPLSARIQPGSLVLTDWNFYCWLHLWTAKQGRDHVLTRVSSTPKLAAIEVYPDGSSKARVLPRRGEDKRSRAVYVRVIRYVWKDEKGQEHASRLVTTLLDWRKYPASELVELYHARWEQERVFAEIKGPLKCRDMELRSQKAESVKQEWAGLLLGHRVVRQWTLKAARQEGIKARVVSFVGTLEVLREELKGMPKGKWARKPWWREVIKRVGQERVPKRRRRVCPRVCKTVRCKWPAKKAEHVETKVPQLLIVAPGPHEWPEAIRVADTAPTEPLQSHNV